MKSKGGNEVPLPYSSISIFLRKNSIRFCCHSIRQMICDLLISLLNLLCIFEDGLVEIATSRI
jgi:hypothetical protein